MSSGTVQRVRKSKYRKYEDRLFGVYGGYGAHGARLFSVKQEKKIAEDFPWSLQRILPFLSGAGHHDFPHMASTGNFSTFFWWNMICGTGTKYREYKKIEGALERKLMDEVEKEGVRAEARGTFGQKAEVQ